MSDLVFGRKFEDWSLKKGPNHTGGSESHLCVMIGLGLLTTTTQLEVQVIVERLVIRSSTHDSCSNFYGEVLGRGGCNSKSAAI